MICIHMTILLFLQVDFIFRIVTLCCLVGGCQPLRGSCLLPQGIATQKLRQPPVLQHRAHSIFELLLNSQILFSVSKIYYNNVILVQVFIGLHCVHFIQAAKSCTNLKSECPAQGCWQKCNCPIGHCGPNKNTPPDYGSCHMTFLQMQAL
jgi:hypothetical protein